MCLVRRLGFVLLVALTGCESQSAAKLSLPATAAERASPARPNATAVCSMTLTAPTAYTHDYSAQDYCVRDRNTVLFEPKDAAANGDVIVKHSLQVRVDPSLAPGTTVMLTAAGQGQLTDKIGVYYSGQTVETRCMNPTGTATLVTTPPNLDVTFDLTCMLPGPANGLHIAGEFKSTL